MQVFSNSKIDTANFGLVAVKSDDKQNKVKILKMNANRTNRSKVINRAIHILFHGRVNKLLTYYCLKILHFL
jgi:hypothetical protein